MKGAGEVPSGRAAASGSVAARDAASPSVLLVTVLAGMFSVGFTITVLAVSIPTIAEDLGAPASDLTWMITGPMLAFAVVGPAAGRVADLFGARRVYLVSLSLTGLFAALTAAAQNAPMLVAFRVLGATVGAATGPASMSIVNRAFPPERRVQALGWWAAVMAGAPVVGVVAGGPVVENVGWRWIFVGQAVFTAVATRLAYSILPETPRRARVRFDWLGASLLAVGVGSLLFALDRAPRSGWTSPTVIGSGVVFGLGCSAFLLWELRAPQPLFPLRYLRRKRVVAPVVAQFFTNFAYMGGFMVTPFLLARVFGYGETRTGLIMVARPLTFAVSGPLAGRLALRFGERRTGIFGAVAVFLSMIVFSEVGEASPDALVVLGLSLSGLGLGASSPSMAASLANAVDETDLGVVAAMQQMVAQVGVVAGIQVMLTVQRAREATAGLAESFQDAYLVGAAFAAVGCVAAAFMGDAAPSRGRRRSRARGR
ncbi:MAG: MFS transporter [Acidimicrobiales bacterium]|nr:MAG: MFS transporter [Acidimicrobiales bacterium]